ncbi:MAG TPA: hypothetical protein VMZ25_12045 [Terriglobales bacterium]|nr:hypothetical protein [Terriglobales bacterium]
MGAPIRTSSDIPDFSTYPSSPSDQLASPSAASFRTMGAKPERQLPADPLHEVATQVGRAIGTGMNTVRDASDSALDRIDSLRSSLDAMYCTFRDRSTEMAQVKFDQVRAQSQAQLRRAKQYAEANPLHVIAAAGVAGLALGFGARAWRNNRG